MQPELKTPAQECLECVVTPHDELAADNEPMVLKCVRCPFCKQTVNAVLTETHIACPACGVEVSR